MNSWWSKASIPLGHNMQAPNVEPFSTMNPFTSNAKWHLEQHRKWCYHYLNIAPPPDSFNVFPPLPKKLYSLSIILYWWICPWLLWRWGFLWHDLTAEQTVTVSHINSVPVHIRIIPTVTNTHGQILHNTPASAAFIHS